MNQPGVLIVSDDASFARAVTARWEQASLAPDVTLATSDVWATAIGERYDVVIVGPLHDEIAAALLEALAEQSVSSVIFVSENEQLLSNVAKFHPNVITISRNGEWLEVLRTASLEALGRTEAADEALSAHAASPDENRCAQLGRNALQIVKANQGAVARTVDMIVEQLAGRNFYVAPASPPPVAVQGQTE